jgi:predicted O-methyltransferase YrrM
MRVYAKDMADVPLQFASERLPLPAWKGVPYAPFDAVALYSMIRKVRPKVFLEVGSGISTCFAYKAIGDERLSTQIVSIDPEPRAEIDSICDVVVREGLETCDLAMFDKLERNDILFFDGSHRAFMNSDVSVFFIDILPRLKPGVIVHIHDVTLPWDYDQMFANWYWNEQYLLAVYLMARTQTIEPLFPTAFVCRDEAFAQNFATPLLQVKGLTADEWRGGGAMWFSHR